jgi:hypothetical protein
VLGEAEAFSSKDGYIMEAVGYVFFALPQPFRHTYSIYVVTCPLFISSLLIL